MDHAIVHRVDIVFVIVALDVIHIRKVHVLVTFLVIALKKVSLGIYTRAEHAVLWFGDFIGVKVLDDFLRHNTVSFGKNLGLLLAHAGSMSALMILINRTLRFPRLLAQGVFSHDVAVRVVRPLLASGILIHALVHALVLATLFDSGIVHNLLDNHCTATFNAILRWCSLYVLKL